MFPNYSQLAIGIACALLLTACGGGGGGIVRTSPVPVIPPPASTPPPSLPLSTPAGPCQAPITGDCVIVYDPNWERSPAQTPAVYMGGGRDSAYRLQIDPQGFLQFGGSTNLSKPLTPGTYRFAGGTTVSGTLQLTTDNTLISDVAISAGGDFWATGLVKGDINNRGQFWLGGTVEGDVGNSGYFYVLSMSASHTGWPANQNIIRGNMQQSTAGTLDVSVPTNGFPDYTYTLNITGQAHLAGTLLLRSPGDGWDAYPLPITPSSAHIIHADGGVFGTFDRWTSPGLFIEGGLRYGSNDVWFDLTRISIAAAMTGQGFGGITLASAANLDRALGIADAYTAVPGTGLGIDQQRFLANSLRLLWMDDAQRAARSLDSLAGHGHAQFADAQRLLATETGSAIARRAMQLRPGNAGHWSETLAYQGANARSEGYDRWLGPGLLMGGSLSRGEDALGFAHVDGQASGHDRMASLYLHRRGDRWQVAAVGMAGRSQRLLQRPIELDDGRGHLATSRREVAMVGLHGEVARSMSLAGGSVHPFVALDYAAMRSARFHESGDTGFELVAPEAFLQQLHASVGARYAREWRLGNAVLGLRADWQVQQPVARDGAMPAAFVGVPAAMFDLVGLDAAGPRQLARVGVDGGIGNGWRWGVQGMRSSDQRGSKAWQLRVARDF